MLALRSAINYLKVSVVIPSEAEIGALTRLHRHTNETLYQLVLSYCSEEKMIINGNANIVRSPNGWVSLSNLIF